MSICYHYEKRDTSMTSEVLGIDVAIETLTRAWLRYGDQTHFICHAPDDASFDRFKEMAELEGIASTRCIGLNPRTPQHNLQAVDCLFQPDPAMAEHAWRRTQVSGAGFALCGLVHTMSGSQIAAAVTNLSMAPTDGNDALICPSRAIKKAVENLWDIHADYLNHRFKGNYRCPIQTPVVPLGIDVQKISAKATPEKRQHQRAVLNIKDDEIVILFVGRLSFISKAHPLPMMQAVEKASRLTKKKLRLVVYGYFKPEDMEKRFRACAKDFCPSVPCDFVMNADPRFPDGLWAAGDIFTSLVDNMQESFGLAPVEAKAAKLPLVISDWDGYRDNVHDGVTGFGIKTTMPPASAGHDIAQLYYNDGNYASYLVGAAQSTAIDTDQAAQAYAFLADHEDKRKEMGQQGHEQTKFMNDWPIIIQVYKGLWEHLAQQRRASAPSPLVPTGWNAAHPAFMNPYAMFNAFPSEILKDTDKVAVVMTDEEVKTIFAHDMNFFVSELLLPKDNILAVIQNLRVKGNQSIGEIRSLFTSPDQSAVWCTLGWLLKHGICRKV